VVLVENKTIGIIVFVALVCLAGAILFGVQVEVSKTCSYCGGDGTITSKVTCSVCGGDGIASRKVSCSTCGGDGEIVCKACGGDGKLAWGLLNCATCGGTGVVTCPECDGTGYVMAQRTCQNCGGTGGKYGKPVYLIRWELIAFSANNNLICYDSNRQYT
jgi:DnaJ-class molecular chaperone